jgi:intracellular septation protein A
MLKGVLADFGPLIVFWLIDVGFGLKPAIAGALLAILIDSLWRWRSGRSFTRLYLLTSMLTVVFGCIDLLSADPFMLKYEAVITNSVTGVAFVFGARGPKPIIQEFAEQREGVAFNDRPEFPRFFQLFTLLWAGYFFVKAGFYWVVGEMLPLAQAMAVRAVVGTASLVLLIFISSTQGRRLFRLFKRMGLLPVPP